MPAQADAFPRKENAYVERCVAPVGVVAVWFLFLLRTKIFTSKKGRASLLGVYPTRNLTILSNSIPRNLVLSLAGMSPHALD